MSNYQRAREWIFGFTDTQARTELDWQAIDELRELLNERKPVKPSNFYKSGAYIPLTKGVCECGARLTGANKYCHRCGKEVDWSVV